MKANIFVKDIAKTYDLVQAVTSPFEENTEMDEVPNTMGDDEKYEIVMKDLQLGELFISRSAESDNRIYF
jgi:hypothetical protein